MMSKDTSGPAFPLPMLPKGIDWNMCGGMSLRDYFAAAALQGLIASFANPNGSLPVPNHNAELPEYAYLYADIMLKEREK